MQSMQHPLLVGLGHEPRIWMKRDSFGLSLFALILKNKGVRNNAQKFFHCFVVVVPLFPDRAPPRQILQQLLVLILLLFNLPSCGWMAIHCKQVTNRAVHGLDYLLAKYVVVIVALRGI